jgi:predicted ArsR family transcriptional regulator
MFTNILKDIARPHVMEIILLLKKNSGMAVNELSASLRMSYMGVKQHCVFLEERGYLDTVRRPKDAGGRPEKVYRLTPKLDQLFPRGGSELAIDLLEAAESVYGELAVERLLRSHFLKKTARYSEFLRGQNLLERAQSLARLRSVEGYMSTCEFDAHKGLRLVEHHSPLVDVARRFPVVFEIEAQALGRVLGCTSSRVDVSSGTFSRIEFRLRSLEASRGSFERVESFTTVA